MGAVQQIGGFLKMLLMGRSAGNNVPVKVDTDGTLFIAFSTGTSTPQQMNLGDAAAVGTSSLASKEDHEHFFKLTGVAHVRLTRNSTTQLDLSGLAGTSKLIEINGEYLDCSTTKSLTTSDNVINSTGGDSGAAAAASTLYYVYASNSQASYAPSDIRLCATAPTNGYLGASGNGLHWRHVGWARTNGSTQFADIMAVASAVNPVTEQLETMGATVSLTNVTNAWEVVIDFDQYVLLPPGWQMLAIGQIRSSHDTDGQRILGLMQVAGATQGATYDITMSAANGRFTLEPSTVYTAASLGYIQIELATRALADIATYYPAGCSIIVVRTPIQP